MKTGLPPAAGEGVGSKTGIDFAKLVPADINKKKLGAGAYASVKLVKHQVTGRYYALKEIDLRQVTKEDLTNIEREISFHQKIDHPHIIKFYDHCKMESEKKVLILLEYAENGDLFNFLNKRGALDEKLAAKYFVQIALALNYIHHHKMIHRDVKPENILLDNEKNAKLSDFGWSAEYDENTKRQTVCGTFEYMAPEIVFKKQQDTGIDVWALGILLFELLHNRAPYPGRSMYEVGKRISAKTIQWDNTCPPDAKELILSILKQNQKERPPIKALLKHPFIMRTYGHIDPALYTFAETKSPTKNGNRPATKAPAPVTQPATAMNSIRGSLFSNQPMMNGMGSMQNHNQTFETTSQVTSPLDQGQRIEAANRPLGLTRLNSSSSQNLPYAHSAVNSQMNSSAASPIHQAPRTHIVGHHGSSLSTVPIQMGNQSGAPREQRFQFEGLTSTSTTSMNHGTLASMGNSAGGMTQAPKNILAGGRFELSKIVNKYAKPVNPTQSSGLSNGQQTQEAVNEAHHQLNMQITNHTVHHTYTSGNEAGSMSSHQNGSIQAYQSHQHHPSMNSCLPSQDIPQISTSPEHNRMLSNAGQSSVVISSMTGINQPSKTGLKLRKVLAEHPYTSSSTRSQTESDIRAFNNRSFAIQNYNTTQVTQERSSNNSQGNSSFVLQPSQMSNNGTTTTYQRVVSKQNSIDFSENLMQMPSSMGNMVQISSTSTS